jgi:hypothetical protein
MNKATITRLFTGSVIAVLSGAILAVSAIALAIWNNVFVMSGTDITGIHGSVGTWSLLALGSAGTLAIAGGLLGGLAAWIGALLLTWQGETKTWFAVLILLGIFNLGFFGMIAYLVAGPDHTEHPTSRIASGSVA